MNIFNAVFVVSLDTGIDNKAYKGLLTVGNLSHKDAEKPYIGLDHKCAKQFRKNLANIHIRVHILEYIISCSSVQVLLPNTNEN